MEILVIGLGGALGAVSRYGFSRLLGGNLWGALFVNIVGCALAAWLVISLLPSDETRHKFWVIGFLGALTTFSTFAIEALQLFSAERYLFAFVYVGLTTTGCLGATYIVWKLMS